MSRIIDSTKYMPKNKFQDIFETLKSNICHNVYKDNMLPSEYQLIEEFQCSRNTVRRAISELMKFGYVQSIKGKGVIILEPLKHQSEIQLNINDISGIRALSVNQKHHIQTKVLSFKTVVIDEKLAFQTNLPINQHAYYIERLRIIEGYPWVIDINYFLCDVVKGLTKEIAEQSIYDYIENDLGLKIIASRRVITIKKANERDKEVLEINDYDCVGVLLNNAYMENGKLFEYTETHYSPEHFAFFEFSQK